MKWPGGHKFSFTVVDDTDAATLHNVKPVYELLAALGIKTTKTAWVFRGAGSPADSGATCEDREYLDWLLSLQRQGFEIGFHNAAPSTSRRDVTALALSRFHELFGPREMLFCNHHNCKENIYWNDARLSGWRRVLYNALTRGNRINISRGHVNGDGFFWGDLCQQHVRYARNFVFDELDSLAVCPEMPYHDPCKPYVNFWFVSADGGNLRKFLANFAPERLKRLAETGGACIAYVHFAYGFAENGKVHPEFAKRMELLATLNGWFVPASQVLDHLRRGAGTSQRSITPKSLWQLERKWLVEKLFKGTS